MLYWFQPRVCNPEVQRRGCWFSSSGTSGSSSYVYLRVTVSQKGISKVRMLKRNCLEVAQRKPEKTVYPNLSSLIWASLRFTVRYVFSRLKSLGGLLLTAFFSPENSADLVSSTPSQFFPLMRAYFFLTGSIFMHWFCLLAERVLNVQALQKHIQHMNKNFHIQVLIYLLTQLCPQTPRIGT